MGDLTTRLDLYKPGGGSTGLILPDEAADIDKINDNMDIIDAAMGAFICTSGTRPGSPFDGQIIYETDTKKILVYKSVGAVWQDQAVYEGAGRGTVTQYIVASLAALDAISTAVVGDEAVFSAAPSTGISFEGLKAQAISGSGATIDWRFTSDIEAATKANLDTFIAAVVAITDLAAGFKLGGMAYISGTRQFVRFTTTAGAYNFLNGLVPIVPTSVAGTGVTLGANGKVLFSAASSVSVNGCFTSEFENYLAMFDLTHGASNSWSTRLRLSGTDNSAASYSYQSHYGSASTSAAAAAASATSAAGDFSGTRRSGQFTLFGPALAATTVWEYVSSTILTSTTMGTFRQSGQHTVATAYDGITFTASASTITGTVRIYGYNDN